MITRRGFCRKKEAFGLAPVVVEFLEPMTRLLVVQLCPPLLRCLRPIPVLLWKRTLKLMYGSECWCVRLYHKPLLRTLLQRGREAWAMPLSNRELGEGLCEWSEGKQGRQGRATVRSRTCNFRNPDELREIARPYEKRSCRI